MRNDDPRNLFFNQRQQEDNPAEQPAAGPAQTEQPNAAYEQKLAEMQRLAAKYEREGEGQLVKDIVNNVLEQKASGNLTNQQLVAFAKRVTPLLNAEQRTRLNALVEQLLKL